MLEGLPTVQADCGVYDPQSENNVVPPPEFIRRCQRLALVLNERELLALGSRSDVLSCARGLLAKFQAEVVVVKQGPFGCLVVEKGAHFRIPVFPSETVFKIGSGDVFSAAFAKFWCLDGLSPDRAAEQASRCTSLYCLTRNIDAVSNYKSPLAPAKKRTRPKVYLAGPFFSLAQRFLVEEARRSLASLGATVFSPLHDVGTDTDPATIALEDLKGLKASNAVLALISDLDPGTIFEVGYARSREMPVVAYAEGVKDEHLTMLVGDHCLCVEDFCSALYNTIWGGMK
jgi:nucleoside 2-deoxyribosyltransferase